MAMAMAVKMAEVTISGMVEAVVMEVIVVAVLGSGVAVVARLTAVVELIANMVMTVAVFLLKNSTGRKKLKRIVLVFHSTMQVSIAYLLLRV